MTINLKTKEGIAIARQLAETSDILIENVSVPRSSEIGHY